MGEKILEVPGAAQRPPWLPMPVGLVKGMKGGAPAKEGKGPAEAAAANPGKGGQAPTPQEVAEKKEEKKEEPPAPPAKEVAPEATQTAQSEKEKKEKRMKLQWQH